MLLINYYILFVVGGSSSGSVDCVTSRLQVVDVRGGWFSLLDDVDFVVGDEVLLLEGLVLRSQDNDFGRVFFKDWTRTSWFQGDLDFVVSLLSKDDLVDGHSCTSSLVVAKISFNSSRSHEDILEGTELSNGFEGDVVFTDRAWSGCRSTLVCVNCDFLFSWSSGIVGSSIGSQTEVVVRDWSEGRVIRSVSIRVRGRDWDCVSVKEKVMSVIQNKPRESRRTEQEPRRWYRLDRESDCSIEETS